MPSLIGTKLPDITLPSTSGTPQRVGTLSGRSVLFFYPYTGKPAHPDPAGWDNIPGAHGSTPQSLAFSYSYPEFEKIGVKVFGVSFQSTEWQMDFVSRNNMHFPLLSDADRKMSSALALETFRAGDDVYLVRRTIVVTNGVISHDFYPVPVPAQNADDVLKALAA